MATDEDLIKLIKEGSKDEKDRAFAVLYDKYKNFVYDFGRTMGIPRDLCSDFLQNVFLRVFEKIYKFKDDKEFFPWLFSLVRNECINFIKKNKKRIRSYSQHEEFESISKEPEDEDAILIEEIRKSLNQLPYEEKEAIFLRYYQDFDAKEIAKILNVSERKVYILIERGIEKIRKHLGLT
jgi:RNA polymerase sigma-70 factor (ECF subfamily)